MILAVATVVQGVVDVVQGIAGVVQGVAAVVQGVAAVVQGVASVGRGVGSEGCGDGLALVHRGRIVGDGVLVREMAMLALLEVAHREGMSRCLSCGGYAIGSVGKLIPLVLLTLRISFGGARTESDHARRQVLRREQIVKRNLQVYGGEALQEAMSLWVS